MFPSYLRLGDPSTRLAFAKMRSRPEAESLPARYICVALAFALAACERSGIG